MTLQLELGLQGVQRAQSEADAVRATTCASPNLKLGFPLSPYFQRMGSQLNGPKKKGSFPPISDFPCWRLNSREEQVWCTEMLSCTQCSKVEG